jgi:hypothetical protein
MEEPFHAKERCARDRRDIVRIGFEAPFSSIDRCPLEIPRLVAPPVALGRPRQGEKAHLAQLQGTEQIVLPGQRPASARRAAVTPHERLATARNDESIARLATRTARRARLESRDVTRRRTEALPVSDRLAATTAMTSMPEDLEVTRRDAHAPRAPVATAGRHDHRDPTVVTTATRGQRARSVRRERVRAHKVRLARLAGMTATAMRVRLGRARSLRTDVHLVPSAATTATRAIAVRVSHPGVPGPTLETARVTRDPVVRRVVGPIDVPAN